MYFKEIPIFEDSDDMAIDAPDGLFEAFDTFVNEAGEELEGETGENEEKPKNDKLTPKDKPAEPIDGEKSTEETPAEQPTKSEPKKKKAKSPITFGQPIPAEIVKAIQGRKYVGIYYEEKKDHNLVLKGFRLIEPLAYGTGNVTKRKNKKTGKFEYTKSHPERQYLRAFVIRDTNADADTRKQFKTRRKSVSKTKKIPYFRLFRVDRIQSWFIFDFVFSKYRTLYNPNDECMIKVIASLDYSKFPRGEKASY